MWEYSLSFLSIPGAYCKSQAVIEAQGFLLIDLYKLHFAAFSVQKNALSCSS